MISQTQPSHPTRTISPDQSTETALVSLITHRSKSSTLAPGASSSPDMRCAVLCCQPLSTVVSLPTVGLVCCVVSMHVSQPRRAVCDSQALPNHPTRTN